MNKIIFVFSEYTAQKKNEYPLRLATKVNDPQTSGKTYRFILKTLANVRKIPVIPQLPINNKLVSNFKVRKKKAETFNEFFCLQCIPTGNESNCSTQPSFVTNERLKSIAFNNQEILKIIRVLDGNKSDGHDDLRMTKICDPFLLRPL